MVKIKGSSINGTIENAKKSLGETEFNRLVSLLNQEGKKLLQNPIFASEYYPMDAYTNFLDILVRERHNGNPARLIKPTEKIIEKQLKGMYSIFVKPGSPEFLVKKLSTVNYTYLQGVNVESALVSVGKATIKYTGFEQHHAVFENVLIGFFRKAFEISGAQDITIKFTTSIAENKGYAELVITWS